jgi:hypothetical protein
MASSIKTRSGSWTNPPATLLVSTDAAALNSGQLFAALVERRRLRAQSVGSTFRTLCWFAFWICYARGAGGDAAASRE